MNDGIEEIAEEGCSRGDGEDQFGHFLAAFDRLMKPLNFAFGMRKTPRFFFETFRGLR